MNILQMWYNHVVGVLKVLCHNKNIVMSTIGSRLDFTQVNVLFLHRSN